MVRETPFKVRVIKGKLGPRDGLTKNFLLGDTSVGVASVGDTPVGDTSVGDTSVGDTSVGDTS